MAALIGKPDGWKNMTPEQMKSTAWPAIWDWCCENGVVEHSFERQEVYGSLDGPNIIAQWITDLKANQKESVS